MSKKRIQNPEQVAIKRRVSLAQDNLDRGMESLYATHGNIVTTWLVNELTHGKLSFEEAATNLARNFMLAHSVSELNHVGQAIEEDLDDHTVPEAA